MGDSRRIVNELLVDLFNQILSIHEDGLLRAGVTLSISEVHVLEKIAKVPVKTMTNIAKSLRVTVGTLSTSINTLVKKGYVTRHSDEQDKRKVLLLLTPKAVDVLRIHDEWHEQMLNHMFDDLKLEDEKELIKAFKSLSNFFYEKYE